MNQALNRTLNLVLKRRIEMEAQRWVAAMENGFDVAVLVEDELLAIILHRFIQTDLRNQVSKPFQFESELDSASSRAAHELPQLTEQHPRQMPYGPTLTLYRHKNVAGLAAIHFELPTLTQLLPSPSTMVTQILESSRLDRYLDSFDGQKMSMLRRILEKSGLEVFFDSVIQVAYLSGYKGDDNAAQEYLELQLNRKTDFLKPRTGMSWANPSNDGSQAISHLFERFLELPDPHDVFKAALAYHVFHGRKVTQAEASRLLKVSRSTLQAHLQLAERLEVATLFQNGRSMA